MIYLDNAATTQPLDFPAAKFAANPSSPHAAGIQAERRLNTSRQGIADILQCRPAELTFTSGGTESNNLAILGFLHARAKKERSTTLPAVLVEPWAHPSVIEPVRYAAETGLCTAHIFPTDRWEEIAQQNTTVLACFSHVHHETGDMTDIAAYAALLKQAAPGAIIFTDGAQGFMKDENGAEIYAVSDMYSFSGHKCHAPAGTGALMVKKGVPIAPLFFGGNQENNLRPGTENLLQIEQLAFAVETLRDNKYTAHIAALHADFAQITAEIVGAQINTLTLHSSPCILNISFPGARGEVLVHMLSERGIYVSMGAACKSRNKRDRSSLALMGFPPEAAQSALRISFSHLNTHAEIAETKQALTQCVAQLRKVSGWSVRG